MSTISPASTSTSTSTPTSSLAARRRFALTLVAAATAVASGFALPALAQTYPDKTIRLVVPFPPGGSTDAVGRLVATEMSRILGQPVVVDNKGGANGNIGSDMVAKAAADGYTLLLSGVGSNAINYSLYPKMAYADKDFSHVTLLATGPNVLVVTPGFPAQTLAEFIEVVKKNPGKYSHASSGNGSSGHLSMEMLKQAAGLEMVHVPYKGGAAAITDTISGQVEALFLNQDNVLPFVRSGKLRALAVASSAPNPAYPDVPTVASAGYAGFSATSWFGLSAPAGTPDAIIRQLSDAAVKAMNTDAVRNQLEGSGFVVQAEGSVAFKAFVDNEIAKWGKAVKASGATAN